MDLNPGRFFRARVQETGSFSKKEMGKPPAEKSQSGRANPVGIPYLYLASDERTAICEIRPHPGDVISVAEFELVEPLNVVDLRNPRKTASPFGRDQDDIRLLKENLPFLDRLADELSSPVVPRSANLEYLPSQYLCESIKKALYQGVVYRSAVGTGINYALFDDTKFECLSIRSIRVDKVDVHFN
jgi:hypothetical protein